MHGLYHIFRFLVAGISGLVLVLNPVALAYAQQSSLAITVTPPLIQLSIGPGESWKSSLKIVNNNQYEVTYYANIVNFQPEGEEGQGSFVPLLEETPEDVPHSLSLGSWVTLPQEPITVPSGNSVDVPFTVTVPKNAEPGGHYAAILVGTQPPPDEIAGPSMKVSSYVTSLLFVKISGDVIDRGSIREFYSDRTIYETPKADFTLRFENGGNVHLQPKGDIAIYNMWGKERGKVEIHKDTSFGIVLPQSIRKFNFSWEGEWSLYDIGRYQAVVTLAYGDDEKHNVSAVAYFWLIPIVPVGSVLGGIVFFILSLMWFVRRYIRAALALEAQKLGTPNSGEVVREAPHRAIETYLKPLQEGVVDLRRVSGVTVEDVVSGEGALSHEVHIPVRLSFFQFIGKYKLFLLFVTFVVVFGWIGVYFISGALENDRPFTISNVSAE